MKNFLKIVLALVLFNTATAQINDYRIANKFSVPGNDGWDYITADDSLPRLYISHGTQVQVLNLDNGKLIGTIPDLRGVHGIAIAQDLMKGYISCGRDSSIVMFDLSTFKTLNKIKVTGANPDAIVYDKASHRIFTFNGRSSNATVVDATTDKVIGTIALEGKPEFAVVDNEGKLFVNIEDKSEISVLNTATMKVENTYSIAPGDEPSGLAIDTKTHRLFSVCENKMMVISDYNTGKIVATSPIGNHPDGVVFDKTLRRIYSSNGEGTITVVQAGDKDKYKDLGTIETQNGARTICVYLKNHHLYLPTAEMNPQTEPAPGKPAPPPRPSVKPSTFVILDVEYIKH